MRPANSQRDVVSPVSYDPKVLRRSFEDPSKHTRRSSIPFADRKPAVRFIRSIDLRKRSITGPNVPQALTSSSNKPILKKSAHPILVDASGLGAPESSDQNVPNTNEDLETCRFKVELLMDKISRGERIGRGSIDVLTFPTSTRRVEALSRYQGCMTVAVGILGAYTSTEDYINKRKSNSKNPSVTELRSFTELTKDMRAQAALLFQTARKFFLVAKQRYNDWDNLLKKNSDFKIDQCKLKFPMYSNKKMPESVTLYEDALEETMKNNYRTMEGYVRICRNHPEGQVSLHCDLLDPNEKSTDVVVFQDSPHSIQLEIIKHVLSHGKDLIYSCNNFLKQGIELLQDKEMEEGFSTVQAKLNSIDYDEYFDPLCALELKNAIGELVARKAELLNTAEKILQHCKWVVHFTRKYHAFAVKCIKGQSCLRGLCCDCFEGVSQRKLMQLLGIVSVEDITVLMPLTIDIAQRIFHMEVAIEDEDRTGGGESGLKIVQSTTSTITS